MTLIVTICIEIEAEQNFLSGINVRVQVRQKPVGLPKVRGSLPVVFQNQKYYKIRIGNQNSILQLFSIHNYLSYFF